MTIPSLKRGTDIFSKRKRSEIMSAVKGKDTVLEVEFRKLLKKEGLKFKTNVNKLPGKPDLFFKDKKFVIFIDGCFWHECKKHFKMPKSNQFFWESKIEKNVQRDLQINKFYKDMGWKILRFWEHDVHNKPNILIKKIKKYLKSY